MNVANVSLLLVAAVRGWANGSAAGHVTVTTCNLAMDYTH